MEMKARKTIQYAIETNQFKDYFLYRVVGFGSNGVVVIAQQKSDFVPVAVKIIYKGKSGKTSPSQVPNEISILIALSGKCNNFILKYIRHWQDCENFYLVTEVFGNDWLWMDKSSKLSFITVTENFTSKAIQFNSGSSDLWAWCYQTRCRMWASTGSQRLPLQLIRNILRQITMALSLIHLNGFYHGDVKSENILVQSSNNKLIEIKICDFGHTKPHSQPMMEYGTDNIMVPELYRPHFGISGSKADIFALGFLSYSLLNVGGELPAPAQAPAHVRYTWLQDLLKSGVEKYPFNFSSIIDKDAIDFLEKLCLLNPDYRMSVFEALTHPFLKTS